MEVLILSSNPKKNDVTSERKISQRLVMTSLRSVLYAAGGFIVSAIKMTKEASRQKERRDQKDFALCGVRRKPRVKFDLIVRWPSHVRGPMKADFDLIPTLGSVLAAPTKKDTSVGQRGGCRTKMPLYLRKTGDNLYFLHATQVGICWEPLGKDGSVAGRNAWSTSHGDLEHWTTGREQVWIQEARPAASLRRADLWAA